MYRFICSKRYVNLLFMLGGSKNLHQLSKEPKVNMTISHISNVTDQWKREGIINKIEKGREIKTELTEIGKQLIEVLRRYDEIATTQLDKLKNKGEEKKND